LTDSGFTVLAVRSGTFAVVSGKPFWLIPSVLKLLAYVA
jgi:hypothetical protein